NDTMQWALLSLDGVQVVVRAGDTLPGGEQVAAIGVGGIELLRGGRSFLLASGRSDPAPEAPPPPAGGQGGSVQMAGPGAPPPAAPARHDEPEPVSVDVGRLDQRAL